MTEHPVHNEHSTSKKTNPFPGRLLSPALVAGGVLIAALIGVTFGAPQSGLARP
jgi:hypothetical protein